MFNFSVIIVDNISNQFQIALLYNYLPKTLTTRKVVSNTDHASESPSPHISMFRLSHANDTDAGTYCL